jgi:hypothetical protein
LSSSAVYSRDSAEALASENTFLREVLMCGIVNQCLARGLPLSRNWG